MARSLAIAPLVIFALCLWTAATDARTWNVRVDGTGDVPTIQAAIEVADSGDVILVAPGRYTWANQGGTSHAIFRIERYREGFTLRGESGPEATIIDAQRQNRVFFIEGQNDLIIDGFTITGGNAPALGDHYGGGIALGHSTDLIRNCIFENNEARYGGGLFVGGSGGGPGATIEHCVFRNNTAEISGGGVWFAGNAWDQYILDCEIYNNTADRGAGLFSLQSKLTIENTVFVNNTATTSGGGIYGRGVRATLIRGCTVAANTAPQGSGIELAGGSPVEIEHTLFGFNTGGSLFLLSLDATMSIGCADLFGNDGGNALPAGVTDAGNNISLDPEFCNPANSPDPTVNNTSPCVAGNHPGGNVCGLIGARPVGCTNTVPTETRTWGNIKAKFR
jgi:predicted outer membrane repeat protein